MNGIIMLIVAVLVLPGCANKEKYKLAKYRTTAAVKMYSDLQTTRQVEAMSKETVAMASMGFVSKGCGNECDKPKSKKAKAKVPKDCRKILDRYDKNCDSAKAGPSSEEVCNDLYSALKAEQKRCEEDKNNTEGEEDSAEGTGSGEEDRTSESTETVKADQSEGSEVNKAIAKATSDSEGSTVINNFIGDNNTSGSYNPSASGAGSVVMGTGAENNINNRDDEAASILSLAGKDVDSDAKEFSDGYFKPTVNAAKDVAWPVAGAYVAGKAFKAFGEVSKNAGDTYENVNNPDNSDNSINNIPAQEEEPELTEE